MSGILKIKMFEVDSDGTPVTDGLNKYYETEDLDYEVSINETFNMSRTLTIERLITTSKLSFTYIPLEIFTFFNLYNKDLTFEDEKFTRFSIEVYFDDKEVIKVPVIKKIGYSIGKPRVHDVDNTPLKLERVFMNY